MDTDPREEDKGVKRMTKLEAGVGGRILKAALVLVLAVGVVTLATAQQAQPTKRSEEHTSELQ
mgnify:CR=1 FL=1